eukprot:gene30569-39832_t
MSPDSNPIDLRKIYADCQHPNVEIELWMKGIEKLFPPYVELDSSNRTESQEDTLRVYTHTKLQILRCAYLEQFLRGDFAGCEGKWIYLVGNGIWNSESSFDCEDDAIDRGCSDPGKGYPKVVFTALVGGSDDNEEQELPKLIPDLETENAQLMLMKSITMETG